MMYYYMYICNISTTDMYKYLCAINVCVHIYIYKAEHIDTCLLSISTHTHTKLN